MVRLTTVRFVGDVHGKLNKYFHRIRTVPYSIQLGDVGFKSEYNVIKNTDWLDSNYHKILGGNHDDYYEENGIFVNQTPHFLGDYGIHTVPDFGDIFFVRGGRSIDASIRAEGFDWFRQEEISYVQGLKALEFYKETKPNFVISHECPEEVIHLLQQDREERVKRKKKGPFFARIKTWNGMPILPSKTAFLLQGMFEFHQPKFWLFGHHHQSFNKVHNGTRFICLNELQYMDINSNFEII